MTAATTSARLVGYATLVAVLDAVPAQFDQEVADHAVRVTVT
jgi:hypothetical protein